MRVALLKLDTDGSLPMGEMSESCKHKHRESRSWAGADVHCWLKMAFSTEGSDNRKAFSSAIPLLSRQISTQTTNTHVGAEMQQHFCRHSLLLSISYSSDYSHSDFLSGYNIIQFETWHSLCLQVEFLRVDLSFYRKKVYLGKDSKSLIINWELYYSPSPHHLQFLPQPLEPDTEYPNASNGLKTKNNKLI